MSNLIRMGIKVALAVFSSYTNDDIDRIDKVSPTQVRHLKGCVILSPNHPVKNFTDIVIMAN